MFKRKIDNLRLKTGGLIDREIVLSFSFNGKPLKGFSGDTVASALAANGIKLLARSFKYHRVRGLYSAGPEEPNVLLSIEIDGRVEVNARVTMITLREGMQLRSQNCTPSLEFDIGAINDKLSPLLSAGFYYKTFIWPGLKGWMFYENIIRKAAGMGNTGLTADNANYEHLHLHCDLLVIGAGLAGISTALAAANSGLDVVLVEQHSQIGGQLSEQPQHKAWQRNAVQELAAHDNIHLLTQTTAFGAYDNKVYTLLERTTAPCAVLERLLEVKAAQCVAATGAIERPLVFVNNDLPGVQLAGSAQLYLHRYATLPGREIVIFCNNNSAYQVAADLLMSGANLRALVDVRERAQISLTTELQQQIDRSGVELHFASVVSRADGDKQLRRVQVNSYRNSKVAEKLSTIACDSLLVTGGWSPTAHLHSQAGGKLHYNEKLAALVPIASSSDVHNVGAAGGDFNIVSCVQEAWQLGQKLAQSHAEDLVIESTEKPSWLTLDIAQSEYQIQALWSVAGKGKSFVDLQHDVSTADIELAAREGYQSVEHLKRYTTLGMATDQGKLSNVNALALMAEQLGQSIDQTGTTRFRPPYTPVTIGAWGANETGHHLTPTRRTPMQQWHAGNGAHFNISGPWRRATDYRRSGETKRAATIREARHVREHAGIVDVSSLGKIRVCGPDALKLLNLVYVGSFDTLKIARARYGVMLREDGIVFDDGTVVRLATDDYLITTTTSNAGIVLRHFDRLTQVDWPELAVACTSVTDQYAAMAIAGPKSREMLQACIADIDFGDEALPFMGYAQGHLGQIPIEICRISFSGEMAYELYTGADYGSTCWQTLLNLNPQLQVYGLDALDTLRIEKGHLTGAEIDGRRTLDDIGMSGMNRGLKPFIGQVMAQRSGLQSDRLQIVGLRSINPTQILEEGMHLVKEIVDLDQLNSPSKHSAKDEHYSQGQLSSVCFSPVVKGEIALAQLRNGRQRMAEKLWAISPLRNLQVEVEVVASCFYDPKNTVPRTVSLQLQRPGNAIELAAKRSSTLHDNKEPMHSAIKSTIDDELCLISIASWPNANAQRVETLANLLGFDSVDYPHTGNSKQLAGVEIFAVGPFHCWLQIDLKQSSLNLAQLQQHLVSDIASVVDISHSYTKVSLSGKKLRALMSRAITIDLRPTKFNQQQIALTRLLGVQSLVHCVNADESQETQFDILFNRAFALDAWQHLCQLSHNLGDNLSGNSVNNEQQGK